MPRFSSDTDARRYAQGLPGIRPPLRIRVQQFRDVEQTAATLAQRHLATAPEEYRAMYDPEDIELRPNVPEDKANIARQQLAGYYAHCTALDGCVRDLLDALDEEGMPRMSSAPAWSMLRRGVTNSMRPAPCRTLGE